MSTLEKMVGSEATAGASSTKWASEAAAADKVFGELSNGFGSNGNGRRDHRDRGASHRDVGNERLEGDSGREPGCRNQGQADGGTRRPDGVRLRDERIGGGPGRVGQPVVLIGDEQHSDSVQRRDHLERCRAIQHGDRERFAGRADVLVGVNGRTAV